MFYVLHESKKLYFARFLDTEQKVREYYRGLLIEQSDKRSYIWETFNGGLLRTFPLLKPRITVSLIPSK